MMQENNFIRRDAKSQSKDQLSPKAKAVMKPAAKREYDMKQVSTVSKNKQSGEFIPDCLTSYE